MLYPQDRGSRRKLKLNLDRIERHSDPGEAFRYLELKLNLDRIESTHVIRHFFKEKKLKLNLDRIESQRIEITDRYDERVKIEP